MRIVFSLKGNGMTNAYARIYKNGVALGTERIRFFSDYESYSEDLSLSLVTNDLLQIYTKGSAWIKDMRFYYSDQMTAIGQDILETEILVTCSAISTTNQDP
jgi:hypothetical protein